jgi:hypothetical protein
MAALVSVFTQRDWTAAGVRATPKTPLAARPRSMASTHFSPGRMLSGAIQTRQPRAQVSRQPMGELGVLVRVADEYLAGIAAWRGCGGTGFHRRRPESLPVLLRPVPLQRGKQIGHQIATLAVIEQELDLRRLGHAYGEVVVHIAEIVRAERDQLFVTV